MNKNTSVERLWWCDEPLGHIDLPGGRMTLTRSFGSGLSKRQGDSSGSVWAVGDRGPNLKIKTIVKCYGAEHFASLDVEDGAKVMPMVAAGPALAELRIEGDRVVLVRTLPLRDDNGRSISGLPPPGGEHARCEPALDLDGVLLPPDPSGVDSEGIAVLPDGSFWISDEYGPSLLKLDRDGKVLVRWVPKGAAGAFAGAAYKVEDVLPSISGKRHLNRGIEALTVSEDGRWLYVAFQSPLAHPDEATHEAARHVRFWKLDAATGAVAAQYLYPLDAPASFRRDWAAGDFEQKDVKVSEVTRLGEDRLLVLERGSKTTKIYAIDLTAAEAVPPEHLELATTPTVEQLSARGDALACLAKTLVFNTDDYPEIAADLEGITLLGPDELLLVNDNDFGVEGAETSFWRVRFSAPL